MKEFIQIETTFFGSLIKMKFYKEDLKIDYYNHLHYLHNREKSAISMRQFIKMKTAAFLYESFSENKKGYSLSFNKRGFI